MTHSMIKNVGIWLLLCLPAMAGAQRTAQSLDSALLYDSQGAVTGIAGNKVYLLFSAHDQGEGGKYINRVLKKQGVRASFFFTGDFLRNPRFKPLVKQLRKGGHYIASHSDKHLLYNDWKKRDSLLVTRDSFLTDIRKSYATLWDLGIPKGRWYLAPYEWYNREVINWAKEEQLQVINFTPGTGTNADYTWPELPNYKSSEHILTALKKRNLEKGLGGQFILIHYGTDLRRTDKFYHYLGELIGYLRSNGYEIDRLP